jgi:hypothetical protein
MQKVVDGVPPDSEFLIHLGDLQYVEDDKCEEWVYKIASDILKRSKVPVFVLPGDNDMNGKRCYDTFDVSTNIVAPYVANHLVSPSLQIVLTTTRVYTTGRSIFAN